MANEPGMYMNSYGPEEGNHLPGRRMGCKILQETTYGESQQQQSVSRPSMNIRDSSHDGYPLFRTAENQMLMSSRKL